jgi:hypothetical protein
MNKISDAQQKMLESDSKIGLLVTGDDDGYPHITFISSLQSLGDKQMTFGKFCEGLSKKNIADRPGIGFLALNGDMDFLRGSARYTHTANTGEVFDRYNAKPMFRYNTYFGFNTIYFMDLEDITPLEKLNMGKIVMGAILTRIAAPMHAKSKDKALSFVGKGLFAKLDGLKFIAYSDEHGKLKIIPIIQAGPAGTDRIAFSLLPFGKELRQMPKGCKAAILAVNLKMESVLVKGIFQGISGFPGTGILDIEKVYNSMPPKNEYIYPRKEKLEAVTEF